MWVALCSFPTEVNQEVCSSNLDETFGLGGKALAQRDLTFYTLNFEQLEYHQH